MTDHTPSPDDDTLAQAALYALGTLDPQETTAFVQSALPDVQAFDRVVQALGYAARPASPPPHLRGRLFERLHQPAPAAPAEPVTAPTPPVPRHDLPFFLRAHEGYWEPGPFSGTTMRTLFIDQARQYATVLLRIAPGAQVETHFHVDAEELYVLEGSCSFDNQTFGVGDYVRMPAGTTHSTVTSESGCLFLAIASTQTAVHD
jgi:anti-sigma factor ChrR (cupin superfamily)